MCFGAVTLKACPYLGLWNTCNSGSLPFWVATLSDCDSVESLGETLGPIFTVCTLDRITVNSLIKLQTVSAFTQQGYMRDCSFS